MSQRQRVRVIDVCIDAQPEILRACRKLAAAAARAMGASRVIAFELEIALGEALTNAYLHAYRSQGVGRIRVRMIFDDGGLLTTVADAGGPLRKRPRIPADVPLSNRRGRGLFLMSRLMDGIEVVHPVRSGRGTAVRMMKRLRPGGDAAGEEGMTRWRTSSARSETAGASPSRRRAETSSERSTPPAGGRAGSRKAERLPRLPRTWGTRSGIRESDS